MPAALAARRFDLLEVYLAATSFAVDERRAAPGRAVEPDGLVVVDRRVVADAVPEAFWVPWLTVDLRACAGDAEDPDFVLMARVFRPAVLRDLPVAFAGERFTPLIRDGGLIFGSLGIRSSDSGSLFTADAFSHWYRR